MVLLCVRVRVFGMAVFVWEIRLMRLMRGCAWRRCVVFGRATRGVRDYADWVGSGREGEGVGCVGKGYAAWRARVRGC